MSRLGVNIDHVATLRQARGTAYPSLLEAAKICKQAGAHGLTLHLREDRRHIQDHDIFEVKSQVDLPFNLEMAATDEMIGIAQTLKPEWVCLVPEKRKELTTEGGLDLVKNQRLLQDAIHTLQSAGIQVSLFIDADPRQVETAVLLNANAIELHTGHFAHAKHNTPQQVLELNKLTQAASHARQCANQLLINAGHGLTLLTTPSITQIPFMNELNIGHALISDALFLGLEGAVKAYLEAINNPRPLSLAT